jgi:hypothetical protein
MQHFCKMFAGVQRHGFWFLIDAILIQRRKLHLRHGGLVEQALLSPWRS